MSSSTSRPVSHEPRRLVALWSGLLTGPLVFLGLLETNYVLAYVACETRHTWFMHLATVVAVLLVAASGFAAYRASDGDINEEEHLSDPESPETHRQRSRWMSMAGVIFSVWFILAILAMEIPILVLKECQ